MKILIGSDLQNIHRCLVMSGCPLYAISRAKSFQSQQFGRTAPLQGCAPGSTETLEKSPHDHKTQEVMLSPLCISWSIQHFLGTGSERSLSF